MLVEAVAYVIHVDAPAAIFAVKEILKSEVSEAC